LSNPLDLANVKSVTTPDVTYVSLNEHNPELKAYLPWTANHAWLWALQFAQQ
jgi:hypothetical protein